VSSALRTMSLDQHKRFHRYHRVLSRAVWFSGEARRVLLELLVEDFVPEGPLIVGVDEATGTGTQAIVISRSDFLGIDAGGRDQKPRAST
jgi:hypothetical protein